MISKTVLGTVLRDQSQEFESLRDSVPRSVLPALSGYPGASALVVKGLRRCGKSTLLKQIAKSRFGDDFLYFNFDDERIAGFGAEDFQALLETAIELFGKKKNLLLDEIQNVRGWELFVNRVLREGFRVFITGSNANLLSRELGTHLTGRHTDIELYPFSFAEYLRAKGALPSETRWYSTEEKARLSGHFKEYLEKGGMPEAVVFSNPAVLTQVLNDIIQKDVVTRYRLRKPDEFKVVAKFLIANAGNPFSYRSITNNFGIKSPNTVQKYIRYAEETYLVFTVRRYERKLKLLEKNPQKVYCVDNGIITRNTLVLTERKGALLENVVAVHLKRLGKDFFYHRSRAGECDFVIPDEKKAIQVCYEMNANNQKRELAGLNQAMRETRAKEGLLLTLEQEQSLDGRTVKPVWQWLLENEP